MKAETRFSACALAEMGRCLAPCIGAVDVARYMATSDDVTAVLEGHVAPVLDVLHKRMAQRSAAGRYEDAAHTRNRMDVLLHWVTRTRRDTALRRAGLVVASRPATQDRREVLIQRGGWLLGTAVVSGADISQVTPTFVDTPVPDDPAPPEELVILQRWLTDPAVRLDHCEEGLAWPTVGGASMAAAQKRIARNNARPDAPQRHLAAKRLQRSG